MIPKSTLGRGNRHKCFKIFDEYCRKRLFCLSQLKRAGLGPNELVQFYRTCIRPITEYACPVFHDGLPVYLSHELEAVQKRAMRILLIRNFYSP